MIRILNENMLDDAMEGKFTGKDFIFYAKGAPWIHKLMPSIQLEDEEDFSGYDKMKGHVDSQEIEDYYNVTMENGETISGVSSAYLEPVDDKSYTYTLTRKASTSALADELEQRAAEYKDGTMNLDIVSREGNAVTAGSDSLRVLADWAFTGLKAMEAIELDADAVKELIDQYRGF